MPVRPMPSIAVLTPYSRQKELLQSSLSSNFEVNSIDGFQGREADIVIFVIVRCNVHCEIGFLTDMRRLNVVMTRAKRGVILLGHKATLTGVGTVDGSGGIGEHDGQSKLVWKRLIDRCAVFDGSTLQAQNAHSE
jgi:regulator of nonsense transcripts 1